MLRQNGIRFFKGLYVTFKLAPDLTKKSAYLSSYNPLNEGQSSILKTQCFKHITVIWVSVQLFDIQVKFLEFSKEVSPCSYNMIM